VFAKQGLPRLESETVNEFRVAMERIMPIKKEPMDHLSALFELARYSDHRLKKNTRQRAIKALDGIRSEILRIRRSGRMRLFRSKRQEKVRSMGTVQEEELTKRRNDRTGLVVFHQDMNQDAQHAYFLKELQRTNERRLDDPRYVRDGSSDGDLEARVQGVGDDEDGGGDPE